MVTSTNEPQVVMDLQTDSQGNWQAQLPANLSPGLHKVVVQSEDGTLQDLALFNLQSNVQMVTQQARQVAYGQYLYPLALLTILVLLLAANSLRIMAQAKKSKVVMAKKQKYTTLTSVLAALASLVVLGYVSLQSGWLSPRISGLSGSARSQAPIVQAPVQSINVAGAVIDPLTKQGVAGVDLTVNEVSIKTQEGGRYVFTDIPDNAFIKLTHPALKKAVLWQAKPDSSGNMDIYFNVDMLNALLGIVDAEAGNHLNVIYAQMPPNVRSKISEQDFMVRYKPFFTANDLSIQSVRVLGSSVQDDWASPYDTLSKKAISLTVSNGSSQANYHLVIEDNQWRVIR